jgi:hypothetical protein
MMTRSSSGPGHILTTHLLFPRSKKGDGPLVHREIYFKPNNFKATPLAKTIRPLALMADTKVDAVDFEMEEDDLMNDDTTMDDGNEDVPTPMLKFKSTITGALPGSTMEALTRPKEEVSEKKPTLNAIAALHLESLILSTQMAVLTLRDVSFPFILGFWIGFGFVPSAACVPGVFDYKEMVS